MWGGVVATEAVIEIRSYVRREFEEATSRVHYWIDLLVELPLVLAVVATGVASLCLVEEPTGRHALKLVFAGAAIAVNLVCIFIVLRRDRNRAAGSPPERLRRASRAVLACFVVGLLGAAVAAVLGFSLALARLR